MLNFNKKKYVSFDNLKSFNGLLQSSLKEKIDGYKSEINVKVDERFKVLSGQQQKDSEVIDAREGQVSLSENLKTYVKKEEFVTECEYLNEKFTSEIEEIKPNVNANTEYINTNKSAIQRVIDFVNSFRCEFSFGETGYIKLPEILSGVIIQWAHHRLEGNDAKRAEIVIPYPKAYSEKHYMITGSVFSRDSVTNPKPICAYVGHNGLTHYKVRWMPVGLPQEGDIHETFVNMIAIGK